MGIGITKDSTGLRSPKGTGTPGFSGLQIPWSQAGIWGEAEPVSGGENRAVPTGQGLVKSGSSEISLQAGCCSCLPGGWKVGPKGPILTRFGMERQKS